MKKLRPHGNVPYRAQCIRNCEILRSYQKLSQRALFTIRNKVTVEVKARQHSPSSEAHCQFEETLVSDDEPELSEEAARLLDQRS